MLYLAAKAALSGLIIAIVSPAPDIRRAPLFRCPWSRSWASFGCGMIPATPNRSRRLHSRRSGTCCRYCRCSSDAGDAAPRNRILVNAGGMLRADLRPLSRDNRSENTCDIVMHCKKIFGTRCATILTVSIFLPQKLHEWRTRYVSATALLTRPVQ